MGEDTSEAAAEAADIHPDVPQRAPQRPDAPEQPERLDAPERPDAPDRPDAPKRPATGEPRVDAALRTLDGLGELPIEEHPRVFERVHGQLVEVLGELRSGADPPDARRTGPQQ